MFLVPAYGNIISIISRTGGLVTTLTVLGRLALVYSSIAESYLRLFSGEVAS